MLQVVGFLRGEEDVISGGINQSTPGQFRTGREGRQALVEEKEEGEGEAKLRYETMENLAKGASLPRHCLSFRFTGGLRFHPFSPFFFLLFFILPTLSLFSCGKRGGEGGGGQRLDAAHR